MSKSPESCSGPGFMIIHNSKRAHIAIGEAATKRSAVAAFDWAVILGLEFADGSVRKPKR